MPFDPDDPRFTAFVLGELDSAERAAIEAMIADDPDGRDYVQGIEETVRLLSDKLHQESADHVGLDAERKQAIEHCANGATTLSLSGGAANGESLPPLWSNLIRLAAAAGLIGLAVTLMWPAYRAGNNESRVHTDLAKLDDSRSAPLPKAEFAATVASPISGPAVADHDKLVAEKEQKKKEEGFLNAMHNVDASRIDLQSEQEIPATRLPKNMSDLYAQTRPVAPAIPAPTPAGGAMVNGEAKPAASASGSLHGFGSGAAPIAPGPAEGYVTIARGGAGRGATPAAEGLGLASASKTEAARSKQNFGANAQSARDMALSGGRAQYTGKDNLLARNDSTLSYKSKTPMPAQNQVVNGQPNSSNAGYSGVPDAAKPATPPAPVSRMFYRGIDPEQAKQTADLQQQGLGRGDVNRFARQPMQGNQAVALQETEVKRSRMMAGLGGAKGQEKLVEQLEQKVAAPNGPSQGNGSKPGQPDSGQQNSSQKNQSQLGMYFDFDGAKQSPQGEGKGQQGQGNGQQQSQNQQGQSQQSQGKSGQGTNQAGASQNQSQAPGQRPMPRKDLANNMLTAGGPAIAGESAPANTPAPANKPAEVAFDAAAIVAPKLATAPPAGGVQPSDGKGAMPESRRSGKEVDGLHDMITPRLIVAEDKSIQDQPAGLPAKVPPASQAPAKVDPNAAMGDITNGKPMTADSKFNDGEKPAPRDERLLALDTEVTRREGQLAELRKEVEFLERRQMVEQARVNRETYARQYDNPFTNVVPGVQLSTFAVDVDTASYANIRRFLSQGTLPPVDAVRIEEMINYFEYSDPAPKGDVPFSVNLEAAGCPWDASHRLVRIGLKGKTIDKDKRPMSNLVFLIDTSGSMADLNKLPFLKAGMKLLVEQLTENDRVAIVTYSNEVKLALSSTPCHRKTDILAVLDGLKAEGGTNGGAGVQMAYDEAKKFFIKGGTNRVILATDGDFNVGLTKEQLLATSEERAKGGIFLSVLGFGEGNIQEEFMEQLADKGNGNYSYIDNIDEARKVLVRQMSATLDVIAKDVKIQVEFNPDRVASFRLIGYENRVMANEDFRNDKKDAGEIGAGHHVTALYEIVPSGVPTQLVQAGRTLKYNRAVANTAERGNSKADAAADGNRELLTVFLRYKQPDADKATEFNQALTDDGREFARGSNDLKWSAAVAGFGMLLRESPYRGTITLPAVQEIATSAIGDDANGERKQFVGLVKQAEQIVSGDPGVAR